MKMEIDTFIPTRCTEQKDRVSEDFVCLHYEAPGKKVPKKMNSKSDVFSEMNSNKKHTQSDVTDLRKQDELQMKRARYDVIKFGMSGFEKTKEKEAKIAYMIKLGANPPQKRRLNYKKLQMIRKEHNREKKKQHVSGFNQNMLKHNIQKYRTTIPKGILGIYGKVKKDDIMKKKE